MASSRPRLRSARNTDGPLAARPTQAGAGAAEFRIVDSLTVLPFLDPNPVRPLHRRNGDQRRFSEVRRCATDDDRLHPGAGEPGRDAVAGGGMRAGGTLRPASPRCGNRNMFHAVAAIEQPCAFYRWRRGWLRDSRRTHEIASREGG